jgi:hypothetical protein
MTHYGKNTLKESIRELTARKGKMKKHVDQMHNRLSDNSDSHQQVKEDSQIFAELLDVLESLRVCLHICA